MASITVVVPVGNLPRHAEFLGECINSVVPQLEADDQLLILDNGTGLRAPLDLSQYGNGFDVHVMPWAAGIAVGYNTGIALAKNELCFMLGSDDKLSLDCLRHCRGAWESHGKAHGWYYVGVQYSDGHEQNCACMAAMVTKTLWQKLGGFELGSDYGFNSLNLPTRSCEIVALSKMLINPSIGEQIRVSDWLLYWVRLRENYYSSSPLE